MFWRNPEQQFTQPRVYGPINYLQLENGIKRFWEIPKFKSIHVVSGVYKVMETEGSFVLGQGSSKSFGRATKTHWLISASSILRTQIDCVE
jgi:hypothetical protein